MEVVVRLTKMTSAIIEGCGRAAMECLGVTPHVGDGELCTRVMFTACLEDSLGVGQA